MEPMVEDLLTEAKALYQRERFFKAQEQFEDIRFNYPGTPQIAEVQFYIGLCNFQLGEFLTAEQEFRTIVREFPEENPFSDDAFYYYKTALNTK